MKIIKRGLWPTEARQTAIQHNKKYHFSEPTAHIDVDECYAGRLPKYKVWCPICKEER